MAKAERDSDGEIVTIVARRSDAYHDVALHYAVLAMLLVPAWWAVVPQSWIDWWAGLLLGWNGELTRPVVMLALFVKLIARLPVRPAAARLAAAAHGADPGRHQEPAGPPPRGRAVPRRAAS